MSQRINSWKIDVSLVILFFVVVSMPSLSIASKDELQDNIDKLIETKSCVGCNLSGADLNRLNLEGADLRNADLSGASFFLADLSGADLSGANLRGAKFGGADLANADLSGADIRGVGFEGAYMAGVKMDGNLVGKKITDEDAQVEIVEKVVIPDESKPKEALDHKQVTVAGGDQEGKEQSAKSPESESSASTEDTSERSANMPGEQTAPPVKKVRPVSYVTISEESQKAEESDLALNQEKEAVKASEPVEAKEQTDNPKLPIENEAAPVAMIDEKNLDSGDDVEPVNPKKDTIVESELKDESDTMAVHQTEMINSEAATPEQAPGEEPTVTKNEPSVEVGVMLEKLLDENKCYGCKLAGVDLSGEDLDGADLEGSDLSGAILENTDLREANLKGVSFRGANLKNADLRDADLYKADFEGADLSAADLEGASVDEANFKGALGYQMNLMTE